MYLRVVRFMSFCVVGVCRFVGLFVDGIRWHLEDIQKDSDAFWERFGKHFNAFKRSIWEHSIFWEHLKAWGGHLGAFKQLGAFGMHLSAFGMHSALLGCIWEYLEAFGLHLGAFGSIRLQLGAFGMHWGALGSNADAFASIWKHQEGVGSIWDAFSRIWDVFGMHLAALAAFLSIPISKVSK